MFSLRNETAAASGRTKDIDKNCFWTKTAIKSKCCIVGYFISNIFSFFSFSNLFSAGKLYVALVLGQHAVIGMELQQQSSYRGYGAMMGWVCILGVGFQAVGLTCGLCKNRS